MFSAERRRPFRALSLGLAAAMVAAVALAAAPARATETYTRPADGIVTLSGHGYGHGHGMSQWGAYGAAKVGKLTWKGILAFYYPGTKLANLGNPTIRVRLDAVGSGTLYVFKSAGLRLNGKAFPATAGVTQYRARSLATAGKLQIDSLSSAGWKPFKTLASPAVFSSTTAQVAVKLPSGTKRAYRGSIVANRASATKVTTVSVLPMESYLRAVVPAEMPASWHANAVRAQAVAARSYANYNRSHAPTGRAWDTCDTTSCQMYSGVPAEASASNAAVAATAGQTLTYGGKATFTQFSAANGGWTSAGSQPYLVSKADKYDGAIANGSNTWTAKISVAKIQARWPSIGTYRQLRIIKRDGHGQWGGRVLTAVVDGSAGSVTVTGTAIRSAFGLRSEWFIPSGGSAAASVRDFNGDQKPDVLAVVAGTGALRMYAGNGASGFKSWSVIGTGFGHFSKVFTAGTWNADAFPDVMAQKPDGTLWMYPGTVAGPLGAGRLMAGSRWNIYTQIFSPGDFSGDGHPDLVARAPDGRLTLYRGNGSGGFLGAATVIGSGWNTFTAVLSPGDFTGDRKADVIARTPSGLLYVYPGNGSGGWLSPRLIGQGWDVFSAIISSGDFNGDGKSDLLGRGRDGRLWMYPGNGTGGFLRPKVVGTSWNAFSVILS